jgi:hypothetical protein
MTFFEPELLPVDGFFIFFSFYRGLFTLFLYILVNHRLRFYILLRFIQKLTHFISKLIKKLKKVFTTRTTSDKWKLYTLNKQVGVTNENNSTV